MCHCFHSLINTMLGVHRSCTMAIGCSWRYFFTTFFHICICQVSNKSVKFGNVFAFSELCSSTSHAYKIMTELLVVLVGKSFNRWFKKILLYYCYRWCQLIVRCVSWLFTKIFFTSFFHIFISVKLVTKCEIW